MAITRTIIVLGALLHVASMETTPSSSPGSTKHISADTTTPTPLKPITSTTTNQISTIHNIVNPTNPTNPTTSTPTLHHTAPNTILNSTTPAPTNLKHPTPSLTTKEPTQQPSTSDSPQVTSQITTVQPTTTTTTTTNASPTDSNLSSKSSTPFSQDTTSSNKPATTTHKGSGTSPDNQTDPSVVTTNPAPESTSSVSQSFPKWETHTTSAPITSTTLPGTKRPVSVANRTSTSGYFTRAVFDLSHSSEGNVMLETCKKLGQKLKGNCSVTLEIQGNELTAKVTINADQIIPTESYKKDELITDKQPIPDTLIAILASSGALVLILCCFAAYCTYHRRSYRKNQQHLTEELQTVENGYHDNPTLEVMEVQPEMQEKKLALNGEFNDSWIVPIDNLLKEDIPDEEDTHL